MNNEQKIAELEAKVEWLEHCLRQLAVSSAHIVGNDFNNWMTKIWNDERENKTKN